MKYLFSQIINMSITGSYCIIAVLFIRLLLKKSPKIFSYALWGIVFFRLLCPISFESPFSIIHFQNLSLSNHTVYQETEIANGIAVTPNTATENKSPAIHSQSEHTIPMAPPSSPKLHDAFLFLSGIKPILQILWLTGVSFMLLSSLVSSFLLKRQLRMAQKKDGYFTLPHLDTPFVFGLFPPKIYLPENLKKTELPYILEHERTHILRLDYLIKPTAFFALSLHWFNPLVWIAFSCMEKDMEMSCDETVLKKLGKGIKQDYSNSLLSIATEKRYINGSLLSFGENNIKARIKNILNYKKSSFWGILFLGIVIAVTGITLISNPPKTGDTFTKKGQLQSAQNTNKPTISQILQSSLQSLSKSANQAASSLQTGKNTAASSKKLPIYGKKDRKKVQSLLAAYGELKTLPEETEDMLIITFKKVSNISRWEQFYNNTQTGSEDAIVILEYTKEGDPILTYLSYNNGTYYYMEDSMRDSYFETIGYFDTTATNLLCFTENHFTSYYLTMSPNMTLQDVQQDMLKSSSRDTIGLFALDCKLLSKDATK